jgi:hypothetical protein
LHCKQAVKMTPARVFPGNQSRQTIESTGAGRRPESSSEGRNGDPSWGVMSDEAERLTDKNYRNTVITGCNAAI